MTSMDATYAYSGSLNPDQIRALARLSDVYGIRALRIDEERRQIAIEYDATRLDEPRVQGLIRGCAIEPKFPIFNGSGLRGKTTQN